LCTYGHQDVYRILGRDPLKRPLTEIERALFTRLVFECWEAQMQNETVGTIARAFGGSGDGGDL
jgi:hypothetical protein